MHLVLIGGRGGGGGNVAKSDPGKKAEDEED
jgi:hypothetical protein